MIAQNKFCKTRHASRCDEISVGGPLKLALTVKLAWYVDSVLILNVCLSDVRTSLCDWTGQHGIDQLHVKERAEPLKPGYHRSSYTTRTVVYLLDYSYNCREVVGGGKK